MIKLTCCFRIYHFTCIFYHVTCNITIHPDKNGGKFQSKMCINVCDHYLPINGTMNSKSIRLQLVVAIYMNKVVWTFIGVHSTSQSPLFTSSDTVWVELQQKLPNCVSEDKIIEYQHVTTVVLSVILYCQFILFNTTVKPTHS